MKTKLLFALAASFLSILTFSQKKKNKEMAVYAEKKGNDYYLIRLEEDKPVPNVYVYSNGVIKPYKNYTDLKDIVMDFPGMMSSNNSTKEEMVSVMKKGDKFYEITSQRKDPNNFEKTIITVYEIFQGQKRIVEEYDTIYDLAGSPYKDAIFIN
ncbi:hypothetical protein [Chryseobacterium herbae]|uniref:Uncharacterized protein n=1 Tax=Chryseobacterium herbae TaxID=2976476 RepID=A0ABT2INA8_9FLAO|nr:hypothetical protein [Chryseobacterium sp. pc1-10]MCT2560310.1 hypothetical protein [Chryseobacterium sp. pc1-10]